MNIGVPQGIYLVLTILTWLVHAVKHGQPRDDYYNIVGQSLNMITALGLLYWGGFFT